MIAQAYCALLYVGTGDERPGGSLKDRNATCNLKDGMVAFPSIRVLGLGLRWMDDNSDGM